LFLYLDFHYDKCSSLPRSSFHVLQPDANTNQ
jgi:hypothetical protein